MTRYATVFVLLSAFVATACEGEEEPGTTGDVVLETPAPAVPSTAMPGPGQEMGMDPTAMRAEWNRHMAAMHAATGDSLRAMIPEHRREAMRMMEAMGPGSRVGMGMGMGMDSAWIATRDSLRRDLDRMQDMGPAELESFLREHDARMQRMIERGATANQPSTP